MMFERPVCEYNQLEMHVGLHGCVWVTVAQKNNGGYWFSRPSEHASPRRDWQRLAQVFLHERSPRRPGLNFERGTISLRREGGSPERDPAEGTVPLSRSRLSEMGSAWARGSPRLSEPR